MTSQKIQNTKNMAVIQPRPTHILYQCAKFGDNRTSFNVICATFNMQKAYSHISIFLASKVCPMLKHSDIYEPITIVILNESLQTFVYIRPVGQCTPDKNVTYVSDVMPRQYTSSLTIQWRISKTGMTISFKYFSWEPLG